jgi:hypothetical protein
MRIATLLILSCTLLLITSILFAGTTGKIVGTVKDSKTGEKLIGVSMLLEGTSMGASTNVDGYYVILNVPPGTYRLRASYVGYTPVTTSDVRVNIDQTTTIDVSMNETTVEAKEVVIVAQRPVVQKDISASRANINEAEVVALPISQVSGIVGLQAGVQGLTIRGGGSDQTAFVVDGLTLRDERNNQPYTAISLLAVQDIQVQTGGFNAEYGNIRSGNINVVTKEGSAMRYNVGAIVRYSPPSRKYFGMAPNDPNSYWIRPYLDDAVAWTGTSNGAWDQWTQSQYVSFGGWNAVAQKTLSDPNPANHLTPEAAQEIWKWQHRKNFNVTKPDMDVDLGFSGPFPAPSINEMFGNLRFYASYRSSSTQYMIPLSRDGVTDYSFSLKLTSDLGPGMKLMLEGLSGRNTATDINNSGVYGSFGSALSIADALTQVSYIDTRTFSSDYWGPNQVDRTLVGAKFTHVLSQQTFYEVSLQRFSSKYSTNPGRSRDTSRVYGFGNGYYLDEAPFGFTPNPLGYSLNGIDGMRMAVGMSNARDTSKLATYTIRGDLASQLDRYNEVKTGFEFAYTDNDVNYGSVDVALPVGRSSSHWTSTPMRFEAYIQDKLEFEGMIANIGVRYQMSYAGGQWIQYDPFTKTFNGVQSLGVDTLLPEAPTAKVSSWSPRLGIAFPITEDAKLFFNYGHFRSLPSPEDLYLIRHESFTKNITRIANPNLPRPRTVQYELGYEHSLFDMFLLRLSGYYKDVSDQSRLVNYIGYNNVPNYSVTTNTSYEDIRGFELTLSKTRGDWIQGFVNYTYMVRTTGGFGWSTYYQDQIQQAQFQITNPIISKPVPQPYGRANIDLFSPLNYGPEMGGLYPLADWRVSLLGSWASGSYFTWVGGGSYPGVSNNIQWTDTYNFDVRISKGFKFAGLNLQLFVDINNVFNIKHMENEGYVTGTDYNNYMKSLHLPSEFDRFAYGNIDGSDRPGNFRPDGVDYQPMIYTEQLTSVASPNARPFYYENSTKAYYQWVSGAWQPADMNKVNSALDNKAYIVNPPQSWTAFLNPRNFFFGLRMSLDVF